MDENAALRRSALAGLVGVVLLAGSVGMLLGAPSPEAKAVQIVAYLADESNQLRVLVASLLLVPGLALVLWLGTGLRRSLILVSGSDRLAAAVMPGMALVSAAALAGQAFLIAPAATAGLSTPDVVDPTLYRLCSVAGAFLALGGLAGASVLVAATSRAAGESGHLPLGAETAGYVVAVTCALGYFASSVAVPLLLLWLAGAAIGVWRVGSHDPDDWADPPAQQQDKPGRSHRPTPV